MWTTKEFEQHLRRAVTHLYDPRHLSSSPLITILRLGRRTDAPLALQNILIRTIESLEPDAGAPPGSRAWRIYYLLLYRYVQQLTQEEVADQLGLSVRHLRREQRAAVRALAQQLSEQYDLPVGDEQTVGSLPDVLLPVGIPGLEDELAWLKDAPASDPVQVGQAVAAAIELARPLADQCDTQLEAVLADELPALAVHPIALRQLMLSLLTVAIARTPGGLVRVGGRAVQPDVEIQFICTERRPGPGLPLGSEGETLRVARKLADLCGSTLVLPAEQGALCASLTLPSLEHIPVLVIDDNEETLEFLQRYALGTPYHLICSRDPQQAGTLATENSPEAIILDVMMPRLDGWTVLGQLKQHPLTRHIPVIVCTVMPQEALALSLGASAFLRKPVTRQAFLAALDQAVALKEPSSD